MRSHKAKPARVSISSPSRWPRVPLITPTPLTTPSHFNTRLIPCDAEYEIALLVPLTVTVTAVVPAFAAVLPVNVSIALPLPGAAKLVLLNAAATPLGTPLAVSAMAALKPPSGVTVAVIPPALECTIESVRAPSVNCTPGACDTCTVICLLAVNPSPLAVTVIVAVPTFAADEAVSFSVEEPFSPLSVTGLMLHAAVTPLGSPLTLRLTAPAYVPLPVTEITSVPVRPCTTKAAVEAVATVSVGGVSVIVIGRFRLTV